MDGLFENEHSVVFEEEFVIDGQEERTVGRYLRVERDRRLQP